MEIPEKAPHKVMTFGRLVSLTVKLPKAPNFRRNEKKDQEFGQTLQKSDFFDKLGKLNEINNGRWMIPQRLDSSSPEVKKLSQFMEKLKSESRICRKNIANGVVFSKQSARPPLPIPKFHEEKYSQSPIRPSSSIKQTKRLALIKDNIVKEIDIIARRSPTKTRLLLRLRNINIDQYLI